MMRFSGGGVRGGLNQIIKAHASDWDEGKYGCEQSRIYLATEPLIKVYCDYLFCMLDDVAIGKDSFLFSFWNLDTLHFIFLFFLFAF